MVDDDRTDIEPIRSKPNVGKPVVNPWAGIVASFIEGAILAVGGEVARNSDYDPIRQVGRHLSSESRKRIRDGLDDVTREFEGNGARRLNQSGRNSPGAGHTTKNRFQRVDSGKHARTSRQTRKRASHGNSQQPVDVTLRGGVWEVESG